MRLKINTIIKAILWGLIIIIFPVLSGVITVVGKLSVDDSRFLQASFMLIPLMIPFVFIIKKKWLLKDIGFNLFNKVNCQKALYFIPLIIILIPVTVAGFYFKSSTYVIGSFCLFLLVGVTEEIYFRGIIPSILKRSFTTKQIIHLSSIIFGILHIVTAFSGDNLIITILTIINAILFGYVAIEITILSGNIFIPILFHFLFDFETKIIALNGTGLMMAEIIRGFLLFLLIIWLSYVLKKVNNKKDIIIDETLKQKRKKRKLCIISILSIIVLLTGISLTIVSIYGNKQMKKLSDLSFNECLNYTLENNNKGVITVGIIKDDEISYKVYGSNGVERLNELFTYEIGSLTKTFTAGLVQKAINEEKLKLSDTIDIYLSLPNDHHYPTIAQLLTHTAGYKDCYLEIPMIKNYLKGRNDFYGIDSKMIIEKLKLLDNKKTSYKFNYSNFGIAVIGCILESIYQKDYRSLLNEFTLELGLACTIVENESNKVRNGWDWCEDDAYIAAGALTSNVLDMLEYTRLQFEDKEIFANTHEIITSIKMKSNKNELMNINMDAIGMAWITDQKNNIIWHNGGTSNYNSYLGFIKEKKIGVVILSNLAPNYRIPATVLGVKLLLEIS